MYHNKIVLAGWFYLGILHKQKSSSSLNIKMKLSYVRSKIKLTMSETIYKLN